MLSIHFPIFPAGHLFDAYGCVFPPWGEPVDAHGRLEWGNGEVARPGDRR